MILTSKQIHNSFLHGAHRVIQNKEKLNRINVFPVRDGDTGSNLASMMKNIVRESEAKKNVKKMLASVADAALLGARGNSGIIFAQYLHGLSETVDDCYEITVEEYARASQIAAKYAYEAVENPVEGTMITVMNEWGVALKEEVETKAALPDIFVNAYKKVEEALYKTKEQLEVLKKNNVVDSGAQGFTYFVEGTIYYIKEGKHIEVEDIIGTTMIETKEVIHSHKQESHGCFGKYRYCTECFLEGALLDKEQITKYLRTKGDSIVVAVTKKKCRIHIHTNEPAEVFGYFYSLGNVIYQKVDDMRKQEDIVHNRISDIAIVTDSVADISQKIIDKEQVHMVHLDILYADMTYLDKLTITPKDIIEQMKQRTDAPTSSQPSSKRIENLFDYLSTYYKEVIVLTVSKELSGTYHNFVKVAREFQEKKSGKDFHIYIINTKQNSGAEGLLVKKCTEYIRDGLKAEKIIEKMHENIKNSKILVQVRTLDAMIASGRLSTRIGKIAKFVHLHPIVTLDEDGKGKIHKVAFSQKSSEKKILRKVREVHKAKEIVAYSIVHVHNEDEAKKMAEKVEEIIGYKPEYICETSSIIAYSAGRGAVAISYVTKE